MTDEQMRLSALQQANHVDLTAEEVIERAEIFYRFLSSKVVPGAE